MLILMKDGKMDLTELYKRLGSLINIREKIRKDLIALQKDSKVSSENPLSRIQSLEDEYERVQQQIIEIDRQIRKSEISRVPSGYQR